MMVFPIPDAASFRMRARLTFLRSSAALAGGSYYEGTWPSAKQDRMIEAKRQARMANGYVYPRTETTTRRVGPANGDYYPGLDRTAVAN